ncbi:MAG TPA: ATP-binding protein [Solirubrobacteraceae bacterium]|nr:ATP-binding protein [Solirubrobacteraceae bacterium]
MPMRVHSSQTSLIPAREERSLLRELGLPVTIGAADASCNYAHDGCAALFLRGMQGRGLTCVQRREVPRRKARMAGLETIGRVELSWAAEKAHDAVLTLPDGELALLVSHGGTCEIVVAARSPEAARRVAKALGRRLRSEPRVDARVPVRFWTDAPDGAYVRRRAIEAPKWERVASNYPARVREAVGSLVAAREPGAGALLLWHGEPGTGKTHALRALVRAWRPWCAGHYVTDPERFLAGTSYLMDVATRYGGPDEPTWRLVVLEDAGELMAATARSETGQGLSRVLNLTDGMLGQGVKCLLLVTTNEPLGRLHPAVQRPGRCWASVDFEAFAPAEATAWLAARGVERDVGRPMTLAELYEVTEGREPLRESLPTFGFSRAAVADSETGGASLARPADEA